MFHLKVLTKETHPNFQAIQTEIAAHPKRHFTTSLNGYNFPATKIKQLLQKKCGVCIRDTDGFPTKKIEDLIKSGKENVVLLAKDFKESDLKSHLTKGASIIVKREDGFDVFQIKKLVTAGKEKTFVLGTKLMPHQIQDYLIAGGTVLLKHGDLHAMAIPRLLPHGKERIYIQGGGFSNFMIKLFLDGKANVIFGNKNLLATVLIEEKVKKYKSQVFIESAHPTFQADWVKKMETLGAIII